jgi:phenylpropionate dioxygenase-like ring-hydroxylating dioxygenase large terminal subunit
MAPESRSTDRYGRWQLPVLGFTEYWYPAIKSSEVKGKPIRIQMLGEWIVIWRDQGRVGALVDRCAHRGARLSQGRCQFPGTLTISCPYHGWTFDETGQCRAAIVEGPGSPLPPKVRIRAFPVAERYGVVWVWMGEGSPIPIDDELPKPFKVKDACVELYVTPPWQVNWRIACDNFIDDLHARYLHRGTPKFIFKRVRAWGTVSAHVASDKRGVIVKVDEDQAALLSDREQATYPGLGKFPRFKWWRFQKKKKQMNQVVAGERVTEGGNGTYLPSVAVIPQFSPLTTFVQWAVPIDEASIRNFCFLIAPRKGIRRVLFRLHHALYFQWTQDRLFIGQDKKMTSGQSEGPERLSASDIPVIVWRRFALENHRRPPGQEQLFVRPPAAGEDPEPAEALT